MINVIATDDKQERLGVLLRVWRGDTELENVPQRRVARGRRKKIVPRPQLWSGPGFNVMRCCGSSVLFQIKGVNGFLQVLSSFTWHPLEEVRLCVSSI